MPKSETSTILVALCGRSPAVITETVWALAHEHPSLIPDRIVVITTREGREAIRRELLDGGIWRRLRETLQAAPSRLIFGNTADSIRVIPSTDRAWELQDIRNVADSAAAADFILETLRQFTENPDVRIVLSVAGGRKTMSVLAALAFTLLARGDDRLCHVLVNPPFERPDLEPRFYFPDPEIQAYTRPAGGVRDDLPESISAETARVTLAFIPFVRFRNLFRREFHRLPGGYMDLVRAAMADTARLAPTPELVLNPATASCLVNSVPIPLNELQFLLLWLLADPEHGEPRPIRTAKGLQEALETFAGTLSPLRYPWISEARNMLRNKNPDYARKIISQIHGKFENADLPHAVMEQLRLTAPDRRGTYALSLPQTAIRIIIS